MVKIHVLKEGVGTSTSTSIRLLGKTVRHHAEGVRRADVRVKSACACAVSLKSLDKIGASAKV